MDVATKKTVLRMVPYGLYVVTVRDGEEQNGFTANWLTQVSFEPPMIVLSIEADARSLGMIRHVGRFGVNILASGRRELASSLGRSSKRNPNKLADVELEAVAGPPRLKDALGYFECEVRGETPAGDHVLVLAEVVDAVVQREGEPLTLKETGFRYAG
ncbi:MAG: flavin reductase [Chloroflexi bacterium]|nr:flavin reductase [Chloroflexota bacterium]